MAGLLTARINASIQRIKHQIFVLFGRGYPPDAFCVAGIEFNEISKSSNDPKFSLKDIIADGILWAVPKHRRSLEKRQKRRFGHPDYVLKILQPKTYLKTCNVCGDDHESGVLCPTCYKKVIDETKAMQDAIQNELKLEPVENEVVVLYDGEKDEKPDEFYKGKRIVEMQKPRPAWFSKNLLQGTTQQPSETKDVKPTDLG